MGDIAPTPKPTTPHIESKTLTRHTIRPLSRRVSRMDNRQKAMEEKGNLILQELKSALETLSPHQTLLGDVMADQQRKTELAREKSSADYPIRTNSRQRDSRLFSQQPRQCEATGGEMISIECEIAREPQHQPSHQVKILCKAEQSPETQGLRQDVLQNAHSEYCTIQWKLAPRPNGPDDRVLGEMRRTAACETANEDTSGPLQDATQRRSSMGSALTFNPNVRPPPQFPPYSYTR